LSGYHWISLFSASFKTLFVSNISPAYSVVIIFAPSYIPLIFAQKRNIFTWLIYNLHIKHKNAGTRVMVKMKGRFSGK